ncbi:MAG: FAD:protein FMN transferase [Acidobacteriota bacterium]
METLARHLAVMGTSLALAVSAPTRDLALDASEAAVRAVERAEALLSTWRDDTPLARLNAAAPGDQTPATPELFRLLKNLLEWSKRSGGAFDPTVAPLARVWGLRSGGRIPTAAELLEARRSTGPSLIAFRESSLSLSRLDPAAGIDEGAWGKGWALDRAAGAARGAGAASFVLDLGGQVLASGEETAVAVVHPRDRARTVATIRLRNASASTSGNSERGLVVNGRRVGHLLDPRTGDPAPDFGSVTVVAPTGLVADILATAMFVLGPKDGLALSERLRAEGVAHEALYFFEGEEGQALRVAMSPGMSSLVTLFDSKKSLEGARP